MKIGIAAKDDSLNKDFEIEKIIEIAKRNNSEVIIPNDFLSDSDFYNQIDLVIVLGGDGTMLKVSKKAAENDIPILGLNFGRIGFLTDLEKKDVELVEKLFTDNYNIDERMMLEADIYYEENMHSVKSTYLALNDIIISRGLLPKMVDLSLYIDNEYFSEIRADGVIFSTPTGSTAYSLSAGGSVIDPNSELIAITPICPHTLKSRPLIINKNRKISICHQEKTADYSYISCDGDESIPIKQGSRMDICISEKKIKLIRILNRNFYSILKEKV